MDLSIVLKKESRVIGGMFLEMPLNTSKTEFLAFFLCQRFQKNVIKFYPQSKHKDCKSRSFLYLAEKKTFFKRKDGGWEARYTSITMTTLSPNITICRTIAMPSLSQNT